MKLFTIFLFLFLLQKVHSQSFPIGQISTTLTDASRSNRQIGVEIFYPATLAGNSTPVASGQFPVIAFGHGFSMTYDAYSNFWNELVPQGYILIFPKTETGPIPFPSHAEYAQDLLYCLNYLQAENGNSSSQFFTKISGKSALLGHSMGGGCSFLAASNNTGITTVVGFAPAETNPSAIAAAATVMVPTLIFIGSKDNVAPASGNSADIYNAVTSSCKDFITLSGGSHCGFAESNFLCEFGESSACIGCSFIDRSVQHFTTFQFLNPWLRFYLKGECPQWTVFQNRLASVTGITSQQSCNYSLPIADFSVAGNTSFCVNDSVRFTAIGNYNYLWSTSETTQSITVRQSGNYSLVVADAYGCNDTSATVAVTVYNYPSPAILAGEDFILCEGETESLFLDARFAAYQWSDGSTDSVLLVSDAGDYFASVIDNSGCGGVSDTVHVEVTPPPDIPVIELRNDTLFVISASGNLQWYKNDTLLNSANGNYYVPDTDGDYYVQVSDSNRCSSVSQTINFDWTSLSVLIASSRNLVFPNPTDGKIFINSNTSTIEVYNVFGEKIIELACDSHAEINMNDFAAGLYFLRAGHKVFKIIKNTETKHR